LFLFTNAGHVTKTKHSLILVRKLVENCFKKQVFVIYLFLHFEYLYFTRYSGNTVKVWWAI